jgi:hypothetical protein
MHGTDGTQGPIGRLDNAGASNRWQGPLEVANEQPGGFGHGVIYRGEMPVMDGCLDGGFQRFL